METLKHSTLKQRSLEQLDFHNSMRCCYVGNKSIFGPLSAQLFELCLYCLMVLEIYLGELWLNGQH